MADRESFNNFLHRIDAEFCAKGPIKVRGGNRVNADDVRFGQYFMLELLNVRPEIESMLTGMSFDPWHVDANMPEAIEFVKPLWEQDPDDPAYKLANVVKILQEWSQKSTINRAADAYLMMLQLCKIMQVPL